MTTVLKNVGPMYRGHDTRGERQSNGEIGTVRVVYEGIEYVFGPNEVKSFVDDGIASAVLTSAGARLRKLTDEDGNITKDIAGTVYPKT